MLRRVAHTTELRGSTLSSQTCTYFHDDLGRISQSTSGTPGVNCVQGASTIYSGTYTYDAFGNITKSGTNTYNPGYSATTNHINGITYDSNGNPASNGIGTNFTWDNYGRMACMGAVTFTYDALDRVVAQSGGNGYVVVYGPDGGKLALLNGTTGAVVRMYAPLPGGATAVYNSSGLAYYRHSDWLGSSRLTSSPTRTVLSTAAYGPFGENYAQSGTADLSFTGQNVDAQSGFYDFLFREYAGNQQGRWISPDPLGLEAVSLTNPQSWNRYAYVGNSPLNRVDPLGLFHCPPPDKSGDRDPHFFCAGDGSGAGGCTVDGLPSSNCGSPLGGNALFNCTAAGIDLASCSQVLADANGNLPAAPTGKADITVYCGGTFGKIDCMPPAQARLGSLPISIYTSIGTQYGLSLLAQYQADPMSSSGKDALQLLSVASKSAEQFIILGAAGSVAGGAGAAAAGDISLVEEGNLFGTRLGGNTPLFNSNDFLRVGWSYIRDTGEYVFRIGGDVIGGGHVNLWPPSWWF